MFCKNCGAPMDDTAKFCPKCGKPVENYTAPKPFEKNSVDGSQNYQYQTSTFTGKQYSTGSSGQINFGTKRKSLLGTIIKIAVVAVIAFVIIGFLLPDDPIYDIRTGTSIDTDTYQTIDDTSIFYTTTPTIYVSFQTTDIEIGTTIYVEWWYLTEDYYITESSFVCEEDNQVGYFGLSMPDQGWPEGNYEIRFFIENDYATSQYFIVE